MGGISGLIANMAFAFGAGMVGLGGGIILSHQTRHLVLAKWLFRAGVFLIGIYPLLWLRVHAFEYRGPAIAAIALGTGAVLGLVYYGLNLWIRMEMNQTKLQRSENDGQSVS